MFPVYLADRHVQTDIQLPFVGLYWHAFFLSLSLVLPLVTQRTSIRVCICWSNENLKAKSEFLASKHWQQHYCRSKIEIGDNSLFFPSSYSLIDSMNQLNCVCVWQWSEKKTEASNGNGRSKMSICHFTETNFWSLVLFVNNNNHGKSRPF